MNAYNRKTALALAVTMIVAAPAALAQDNQNQSADILHNHEVNETRYNERTNINTDVNTSVDESYRLSYSDRVRYDDTFVTEIVNSDINRDSDEHAVSVKLDKKLKLKSDIELVGNIEVNGLIEPDSAAIAIIDNRQSITDNDGDNELLDNDASISDDVASDASGNMGFNVAAGDNNAQDNAVALSAADASFAFGMADAEVFVQQTGAGNHTSNSGVTNAASVGGNAFRNASGNMGVNVASGNNNAQKNALAASVATAAIAQSSVSSNQISTGNEVENAGFTRTTTERVQLSLTGTVSGSGTYKGSGSAYQKDNYYLDSWTDALPHPSGSSAGHIDLDAGIQNATRNPNKDGVGGIAFDTDEEGTVEFLGDNALDAMLSGTLMVTNVVAVNATNTASLSGNAFGGASGNIGVNVAAGTGNLQANSLALAVTQPGTGGGGGGEGP